MKITSENCEITEICGVKAKFLLKKWEKKKKKERKEILSDNHSFLHAQCTTNPINSAHGM